MLGRARLDVLQRNRRLKPSIVISCCIGFFLPVCHSLHSGLLMIGFQMCDSDNQLNFNRPNHFQRLALRQFHLLAALRGRSGVMLQLQS